MTTGRRALLQMTLAIVLALMAGLLVFRWLATNRPVQVQPKAETVQTVPVTVAARPLPRGTLITEDMLKTARYIEDSVPEGAVLDRSVLPGRVLALPVGPGEPVTEFRLYPDDVKTGGVSAMIAPGKRAMAVKGNKVLGLSGFIRPGNRVDVLVALSPGQKMEQAVTKVVLENVLVLATGTELQPGEDGEEPSSVDTYTLELSPEESELLAWAANQGTLHFALRNGMDDESVLTEGSTMAKTLAQLRAVQPCTPKAAPRQVAQKAAVEVEVITGKQRRTQEF